MSNWGDDESWGETSWEETPAPSAPPADAATPEEGSGGDDAPQLYYGSVDEFFREYLRLAYRRPINGRARVWAAEWWNYDEAVIRLEALWRSWEELRQDASTGMSVWWRDHADHHMAVLMDPDGPFAAADHTDETNQSRKGEPLPYTAPPAGLFRDVRLPDEPVEPNDTG